MKDQNSIISPRRDTSKLVKKTLSTIKIISTCNRLHTFKNYLMTRFNKPIFKSNFKHKAVMDKGTQYSQRGDNRENSKIQNIRVTGPISTKFVMKHP